MSKLKTFGINKASKVGNQPVEYYSDPVPDKKIMKILYFGAAIPSTGIVSLEWGDDSNGWELVKGIATGTYEFPMVNQDFLGNGEKKFKITKKKNSQQPDMDILCWFKTVELV